MSTTTRNLYYGDNLQVLRNHIQTESVDLVYLDPPFNSQIDYNVIFRGQDKKGDQAQITAFTDTWTWGGDDDQVLFELTQTHGVLAQFLSETVTRLGRNSLSAYLVMMSVRLLELHRVLKGSGSIYLHVDASASHYMKVILDIIFGPQNFRNEIIWKGADAHNDAKKQFAGITDRILFYSKDHRQTFFQPQYTEFPEKTLREWYLALELPDGTTRRMTRDEIDTQQIPKGARRFNAGDMASPQPRPNLMFAYKGYPHPAKGWRYSVEKMAELDAAGLLLFPKEVGGRIMRKRYLDEAHGPVMPDLWADISQLRGHDLEKLGYPTQKPVALLERIVQASSKPGDVVLDPFCGCGTTISAAEKLGRSWIGIDITHLSVSLIKARLRRDFALLPTEYTEEGTPTTLEAAQYLFEQDPFEFQFWILGEIAAQPYGASSGSKKGKKGADGGIDGQMFFMRPDGGKVEKVIVSVKGGKNLTAGMVRDLAGVLTKESAAIGVFICLAPPTAGVIKEAQQQAGYEYGGKLYARVQVLTVADILQGKQPDIPKGAVNVSYEQKQVKSLETKAAKGNQPGLF